MRRIPLNVFLSPAAQIIEDTVSTSTQSRSDDELTEHGFLVSSMYAKVVTLWLQFWIGIGRRLEHIRGLKLVRTLTFSLDGSNISDRSGHAWQDPIEAAIFAERLGVGLEDKLGELKDRKASFQS